METFDEHLDPLLAEALGEIEPDAALVDRICALTDARLSAAIAEAIGPHSVACDEPALVRGVLAATSDRPAVAGRIGFATRQTAYRVAALVALAVGAYVVIDALTQPAVSPPGPIAANAGLAGENGAALDAMEYEFASFTDPSWSAFDRRIAQVSAGVEQVRGQSTWAESPDALVDRAAGVADWYQGESPAAAGWF